jgi:hypothetical protein
MTGEATPPKGESDEVAELKELFGKPASPPTLPAAADISAATASSTDAAAEPQKPEHVLRKEASLAAAQAKLEESWRAVEVISARQAQLANKRGVVTKEEKAKLDARLDRSIDYDTSSNLQVLPASVRDFALGKAAERQRMEPEPSATKATTEQSLQIHSKLFRSIPTEQKLHASVLAVRISRTRQSLVAKRAGWHTHVEQNPSEWATTHVADVLHACDTSSLAREASLLFVIGVSLAGFLVWAALILPPGWSGRSPDSTTDQYTWVCIPALTIFSPIMFTFDDFGQPLTPVWWGQCLKFILQWWVLWMWAPFLIVTLLFGSPDLVPDLRRWLGPWCMLAWLLVGMGSCVITLAPWAYQRTMHEEVEPN